jgi:hypothetical protein
MPIFTTSGMSDCLPCYYWTSNNQPCSLSISILEYVLANPTDQLYPNCVIKHENNQWLYYKNNILLLSTSSNYYIVSGSTSHNLNGLYCQIYMDQNNTPNYKLINLENSNMYLGYNNTLEQWEFIDTSTEPYISIYHSPADSEYIPSQHNWFDQNNNPVNISIIGTIIPSHEKWSAI